ncbi:hypothetical protein Aca07nite_54300 [Actinoplanes capillaceus]|uniref:DUF881 domain-containing protein n=1 Tax=Actinoplanes campanulatus TaxID=113559 RepID=A0ABQ3WPF2_9ACTN|nr:DUF881 domain-containing protein [Actinoplanes capillaceus]GID48155.1 hypothetical protein Aca07nite_54300 [Actinoplanes capillaceus]
MIEPDEAGRRAQTAAGAAARAMAEDPEIRAAVAEDEPAIVHAEPADDEPTVSLSGRAFDLPARAKPADDAAVTPGDDGAATADGVEADAADVPSAGQCASGVPPRVWDGPGAAESVSDAPTVRDGSAAGPDAAESVSDARAAAESEGDAQAAGVPRSGDREDGEAEISATSPDRTEPGESDLGRPGRRWPAPAGALIWVLLALFGFTLVVQLRSNDADDGLAGMRQEDLVRILSDLEAQDSRLLTEIQELETSKQQLSSGVAGREAAQVEAEKRSQQLGLLAGTVAGSGPGLDITLSNVRASDVLNAVQELRGAGGEVMQLNGANGTAVRVVASSFFVDASGGGIIADGEQLTGPFRLLVIGPPSTMSTALQIPGGVVASVQNDGGSVTMDSRSLVDVTAVRKAAALRYARPVS